MGAPSAQVQSNQSSAPAGKNAGVSPSTPSGSGKGASMAATSGQPQMGQPNTNGNAGLAPVNTNFVSPVDGSTNGNPYPNTIGDMGNQAGQPMGKGGGSGQGVGKNSTAGGSRLENMPSVDTGMVNPSPARNFSPTNILIK